MSWVKTKNCLNRPLVKWYCYAPSLYLRTDREREQVHHGTARARREFISSALGPKSHSTQGNPTRAPNKGVWQLIYRQFFVSVTGVAGVTWLARQDERISCLFLGNMTQVLETVVWSLTFPPVLRSYRGIFLSVLRHSLILLLKHKQLHCIYVFLYKAVSLLIIHGPKVSISRSISRGPSKVEIRVVNQGDCGNQDSNHPCWASRSRLRWASPSLTLAIDFLNYFCVISIKTTLFF